MRYEDVGTLDVAMDCLVLVQEVDAIQDLARIRAQNVFLQGAERLQQVRHRPPRAEFHQDVQVGICNIDCHV